MWITYGTPFYSAKRLIGVAEAFRHHQRRRRVRHDFDRRLRHDWQAVGGFNVIMIRFGQMTQDEFFVTVDVAREGVRITNLSDTDPLVMLKLFGPGIPVAASLVKE